MLLELVVVSSMLTFHPSTHFLFLQVIWVTGLSMVLMAGLIYLPLWPSRSSAPRSSYAIIFSTA